MVTPDGPAKALRGKAHACRMLADRSHFKISLGQTAMLSTKALWFGPLMSLRGWRRLLGGLFFSWQSCLPHPRTVPGSGLARRVQLCLLSCTHISFACLFPIRGAALGVNQGATSLVCVIRSPVLCAEAWAISPLALSLPSCAAARTGASSITWHPSQRFVAAMGYLTLG